MTGRLILSFNFLPGHILKFCNTLAGRISSQYILEFGVNGIRFEMRSSDNFKFAEFPISGEVIAYQWDPSIPVEKRNFSIALKADTMKNGLKSTKKNSHTPIKIFSITDISLSEQKDFNFCFCSPGDGDGCRSIRVHRASPPTYRLTLPPLTNLSNVIHSTGAKDLSLKLSNFTDDRDIELYIYQRGAIIRGYMKAQVGISTEILGDLTDEDLRQFKASTEGGTEISKDAKKKCVYLPKFIPPLRALCAMYDGMVLVYSFPETNQVAFVNHISYLGKFSIYMSGKD